jgi:hypothetical protein
MHDTTATLVAPAARQGSTAVRPSSEVPLARGLDAPSGEFCLARGLNAPSGGVLLARGLNPTPRARSASPEGSTPLGEDRLARGHLHARYPCSCPRVRAFNALTPQDAHHDLGTPGNRVSALFHQLPGGGHPRRCVALCGEAGVSSVTLCRLPPYDYNAEPSKGGRQHPRMSFLCLRRATP